MRSTVFSLFAVTALVGCGGGGSSSNGAALATAAATSSACNCGPSPGSARGPVAAPAATRGPSVPVAATPSASVPIPGGPPSLIGAGYRDQNGSRALDRGDVLVLRFDGPVTLAGFQPSRDLVLVAGDDLGSGAAGSVDAARREQVLVTLGDQPRLSVFGTYSPGAAPGPGKSPARVGLAPGRKPDAIAALSGARAKDAPPVAVIAEAGSRFVHQGRLHAEPAVGSTRAYYGNLHAHTGFSDGKDDPAKALDHARRVGKLDFMCTTDHLEQLTDSTWTRTLQMVDAANVDGKFVALAGWEWGHGYQPPKGWYNHINAIGTRHRVGLAATISAPGLYKEAVDHCLPDGAVGKFNHPHIHKPPLVYNQWDDFAYDARADLFMRLIRVEGNGSKQTKELGYIPALDKGWHVSPVESQDNHGADWGSANDRRGGVWLAALTRKDLLQALGEGRTFASDDRDATIRLLADGAIWMGSTVARPGAIQLSAEVGDATDGFARIELISRGGAVVGSIDLKGATSGRFDLTVDPTTDSYFWARAIQTDGDELFSAPIFVDR